MEFVSDWIPAGFSWIEQPHLAALARPAAADLPPTQAELVRRVEAYFNGFVTLEATFRQLAPDGGLSTGKLYIDRNREAMRIRARARQESQVDPAIARIAQAFQPEEPVGAARTALFAALGAVFGFAAAWLLGR